MKIKQLGNGTAFDTEQTNSSFLIDLGLSEPTYLLFDCGYNVFTKLRELGDEIIKGINYVYISHLDDDHIGSLKSLIYYRYYHLNLTTTVYGVYEVFNELEKFFEGFNTTFKFGKFKKAEIVNVLPFSEFNKISKYSKYSLRIEPIETYHHLSCYGINIIKHFNFTDNHKLIYISGDTKVCDSTIKNLENILYNSKRKHKNKIFHDFSNWNEYDQQVHTCEYDFNKYYSELIDKGLVINKYHNSEKFDDSWQDI